MAKRPKIYSKPRNPKAKKFVSKERATRQKMYDKNWSNYRFRFLHHNPKCYVCGEKSTVVDHIVSHKGDVEKFWDKTNYLPLCKTCHGQVTLKFERNIADVESKMKWIDANRKKNANFIKVKIVEFKGENE